MPTAESPGKAVSGNTLFAEFELVNICDANKLNGEEKTAVRTKVIDKLFSNLDDSSKNTAFASLLYAFAVLSTSTKAIPDGDVTLLSANLGETKTPVTVLFKDLNSCLMSCPELVPFSNKVRTFCRTFAEEYLSFCKNFKHKLTPIARANNHGIPAEYWYVAADFIQTTDALSVEEQAALFRGRIKATETDGSDRKSVINLSQLN